MPWNNQGGEGGTGPTGPSSGPSGPRGPWGKGQAGGNPGEPPSGLEDFFRKVSDRFRGLSFNANTFYAAGAFLAFVWLASGIYVVDPDAQGVVLRFGAVKEVTGWGWHYHLPWPIEVAYTPKVETENQINIGYQATESSDDSAQAGDVSEESHMLTGDENIVDVNFAVYWKIVDAPAFLFNVPNPQDATIKAVAESAMREVVGESQIERIQTLDRGRIQARVRDLMQKAVDTYGMGVKITRVNMLKPDPPAEVIAAYRDVQAARADQERKRNEAEGYANTIVPQARGQAAHIVQDAEAYRLKVIAEASGQAKRFSALYAEYRKAPEVTRRRIYIESMSQILGSMNKVIVDSSVKGYFQLSPLQKGQAAPSQPQPAPGVPTVTSADQGGGP